MRQDFEPDNGPNVPQIGAPKSGEMPIEAKTKLRRKAEAMFRQIFEGKEAEARKAIRELYDMSHNSGEDGQDAVRHVAFRISSHPLDGVLYLTQYERGSAILREAVPKMIQLMQNDQPDQIDYLLREVQGRSPEGKNWAAWKQWWEVTGKTLFNVPTPCWPQSDLHVYTEAP